MPPGLLLNVPELLLPLCLVVTADFLKVLPKLLLTLCVVCLLLLNVLFLPILVCDFCDLFGKLMTATSSSSSTSSSSTSSSSTSSSYTSSSSTSSSSTSSSAKVVKDGPPREIISRGLPLIVFFWIPNNSNNLFLTF